MNLETPTTHSVDATSNAGEARARRALAPPWRAALGSEELARLLEVRNLRALGSVAFNWALVLAAMALVAAWPNPLSVLLALFVIGARQLGFAVLMHEAAHRSLLTGNRANDLVGQWLCAYPIWSDTIPYREYHLRHHAHTGGAGDPDLGLIRPFPITRASLKRKVLRDLSGRTGIKFARAAFHRSVARFGTETGRRATLGALFTNLTLLALLTVLGAPELYLLWAGAWFTTYTLVTRIRAIAEHALTPDAEDALNNTRTVPARWWERLLICPHHVNYHLEHHLLMTAPHYHLPKLHALLARRGVLDGACIARGGYLGVLRLAASKPAA